MTRRLGGSLLALGLVASAVITGSGILFVLGLVVFMLAWSGHQA